MGHAMGWGIGSSPVSNLADWSRQAALDGEKARMERIMKEALEKEDRERVEKEERLAKERETRNRAALAAAAAKVPAKEDTGAAKEDAFERILRRRAMARAKGPSSR